jgi:hypothetical protein
MGHTHPHPPPRSPSSRRMLGTACLCFCGATIAAVDELCVPKTLSALMS